MIRRRERIPGPAGPNEYVGGLDRRVRGSIAFCVAFGLLCVVYAPASRGPFLSDDLHYVSENPFVRTLSIPHLRAMLDPRSDLSAMVENWSPVHLLLHALAWNAFGNDVLGHHLLNLALHALGSVFLARLLRRSGLSETAAWFGGAIFLLHPANVEAVAWISQLKSVAALVLALGALLLLDRRPALATASFVLALLAKPTAAFALPFAAAEWFSRRRRGEAPGVAPRWLVLWTALFCAFAFAEFALFHRSGQDVHPADPEWPVRLRSVVANAFGYLRTSVTTIGLSTFHEPEAARSALDSRWLAGLIALGALGARTLHQLRDGRNEALWWLLAAVSFLPVSQVFPFLYPVADRYLYFILPGLIGGSLLALADQEMPVTRWLAKRVSSDTERCRFVVARVAIAVGAAFLVLLAARSHERSRIWSNPALVFVDSARHYPNGMAAGLLHARRAARGGDARGAAEALRRAFDRGFVHFEQIESDPSFGAVREAPEMRAVLGSMANWWITRIEHLERPTPAERALLERARALRGDRRTGLPADLPPGSRGVRR